MIISLIAAVDEKNGIGKNNQLLCHIPADLKYFKKITSGHHILMGRKTFESVGRPLPNRTNIVITKNTSNLDGCVVLPTIEEGIEYARNHGEHELFVTGGGMIFELTLPLADKLYLTRIRHTFDADTFFPNFSKQDWEETFHEKHPATESISAYSFIVYHRKIVM